MHSKKFKNLPSIIIALILIVGLGWIIVSGHSNSDNNANDKQITVGVVGTIDNDIWKEINHKLQSQHIHVNVKVFNDGEALNQATANGQIDINSFQHYAFLKQEEQQRHYKFSVIGQTYIQPLNVYSKQLKSLNNIKDGSKIAIPNNPTNAGRALKVLQKANLIKTDPAKGYSPTPHDIISNPHHLNIVEVDPAAIVKLLPNFAAGITNSNFIQANHMNPAKDAIFKITPNINDSYNKPWINILVTKKSEKNNSTYRKIVKAYNSKAVAKVIDHTYRDVSYPAFKY